MNNDQNDRRLLNEMGKQTNAFADFGRSMARIANSLADIANSLKRIDAKLEIAAGSEPDPNQAELRFEGDEEAQVKNGE